MIDWKQGGWTSSIRTLVTRDIKEHRQKNEVYRQSQHSWVVKVLRSLIAGRGFGDFILFYALIAVAGMLMQYGNLLDPGWLSSTAKKLIDDAASVLVTIQTGALAMVSIAIGLIALLSEKEGYHADVKVYYYESLAYEVVSSSLSLLLVIGVQVMWPLFEIVKALPGAGQDEIYKTPLLAFHIGWLCVNLWSGAHFVVCTFHFVDPSRRQMIRQRYIASEVVLPEIAKKIAELLYINIPQGLRADLKKSSYFGLSIWDGDAIEIRRNFRRPRQLVDVRTRWARWAVTRWALRSRQRAQTEEGRPNALRNRRPYLSFPMGVHQELRGSTQVCIRRGGVPLARREKVVLWLAFRFKAMRPINRTLPADVQDELAGKVTQAIQALSPLQFDKALEELLDYHTFLLRVHADRDPEGRISNYADIAGLSGRSPQERWLSAYRRVFEEAVARMADDQHFINTLAQIPFELLPGRDDQDYSPLVTSGILDLIPMLVHRLEAWITKRTITVAKTGVHGSAVRSALAGSDQAVVSQVFERVVASWEQVLSMHLHSVNGQTALPDPSPSDSWKRIVEKWPLLQRHMTASSECLALAVWNEDSIGAHLLRDQLVKWAAGPGIFGQEEVWSPDRRRCFPEILELSWEEARKWSLGTLGETYGALAPRTVLIMLLESMHEDVLLLSAAVFLNWTIDGKQESEIGAETAIALLRQQPESLESDFYDGRPFTFQAVFGSLVRMALADKPYQDSLDSLVQRLDGMTERRVISGRIFAPSTLDEWQDLREVLLAILTAYHQPVEEAEALQQLQDIADAATKTISDARVQELTRELQRQVDTLKNPRSRPLYATALARFRPGEDVDVLIDATRRFLALAVATLAERREKRIRDLPIDHTKLESLRRKLETDLANPSPEVSFLDRYVIDFPENVTEGTRYELQAEKTLKSTFVSADMESTTGGVEVTLAKKINDRVAHAIRRSFLSRSRARITTVSAIDEAVFWASLRDAGAQCLGRKVLLISPEDLKTLRGLLRPPGLPNLAFERRYDLSTRKNYIASHGDIDVFRNQLTPAGTGVLLAANALRRVRYTTYKNGGKHLDIHFAPGSDIEAPLTISFVQSCEWRELPAFDIFFRSKRV